MVKQMEMELVDGDLTHPPQCETQHRVKLAELTRLDNSLRTDGVNVKAVWKPKERVLCVLVRRQRTMYESMRELCDALMRWI